MPDYQGGNVVLDVIPSFRGIQRTIAAESQRWGRESGQAYRKAFDEQVTKGAPPNPAGPPARSARQGRDSGGAFADGFRRQVEAALKALPPVRIGAATSEAEQKIRDLSADLRALSDQTVGVDIDTGAAMAELARIRSEMEQVEASSADIAVRVDAAAALAALRTLEAATDRLDGKDAEIDVRVNDAGSLNTFTGRLLILGAAGAALAPAIVPAAGLAAVAVAGIGAAAVSAVAGVSVLALAFSGIGDAVKAMGDVQRDAGVEAQRAALGQAAAASAVAGAQRQVAQAEAGLANARRTAGYQAAQAAERVAEAHRKVSEAAEDAARDVEQALADQRSAERDLADAQEDTRRSQQDLTAARAAARAELEDLEFATRGAALAEEDASLALVRAQERLALAQAEGVTGIDMQEVDLAVRQAQLRLDEARDRNVEVGEAAAAATAAGVEGAQSVLNAQQRVADARRGEEDAAGRLAAAEAAVAQARVDGAARIVEAQRGVTEAIAAQQQQQESSAAAIAGAVASLEGAQASLAQATTQTGDIGSASMRRLQDSMAALSPAGVAFAAFIFSLRDELDALQGAAQGAFLPGLQTAIETMMPAMPGLLDFITRVGTAMAGIAQAAAVDLMGPAWAPFFDMVSRTAVPNIEMLASMFGNFAQGIGDLLVAFEPLTSMFMGWLTGAAARFAEWAAGLTASDGFQSFVDYILTNAPAFGAMIGSIFGALGNIIAALAPMAPVLMSIVTGIMNFISAIPPGVLAAIIAGIAGLVIGFQVLAPIIGVVATVAAGLAGGLSVMSAVVGALGGPITLIVGGLILLGVALVAAYQHSETFRDVVHGALGAVAGAFQTVWGVVQTVFGWLLNHFDAFLFPVFRLFGRIVGGVLTDIGGFFQIAWSVISTIFNMIRQIMVNIVFPLFADWFNKHIRPIWDNHIRPIFDMLGNYIRDHVAPAFQAGLDVIARIWEGLRDIAKAPVRFVVETVINRGIIENFNKLVDVFPGMKKVDPISLPPGFATGGILPGYTPGRDVHRFISRTGGMLDLSGGEAIMRPEFTAAAGPDWINQANRAARQGGVGGVRKFLGGYADGGILGWIGRTANDATDAITNVVRTAGDLLTDPTATLRRIVGGLLGDDNTGFAGLVSRVPLMLVDGIASMLTGMTRGDEQAPLGAGSPIAGGYRSMMATLLGAFPAARITSTVRPGAITAVGTQSMHSLGRAIDIGSPNAAMFNWLAANYPNSKELFYSPMGPARQILNGRPGARLAPVTVADHYDHIHWAMANGGIWGKPNLYDDGGYLPPGLSTVMNATGKPEPILTSGQWDLMRRAAERGGNDRPALTVNAYGAREDVLAANVVRRLDEREALKI